jgi:hypothetical protein
MKTKKKVDNDDDDVNFYNFLIINPLLHFFTSFFTFNCLEIIQVMANDMAFRLGWINASVKDRAFNLMKKARLPVSPPKEVTMDKFKSLMAVSLFFLPSPPPPPVLTLYSLA